jgi:chaperone required for assembly of F1-ATPase
MRDILYPDSPLSDPNPIKRAQNAMARQPLPKRFYKEVSVVEEGGRFALKLDGKGARTPARQVLALPTQAAAAVLAAEWSMQREVINPHSMPATRIVNSALDGVAARMTEVREEILRFASSDLVCYRASEPEGLVMEQTRCWDPVLTWGKVTLGAEFVLANGVVHTEQPAKALTRITHSLDAIKEPIALAALHVMTTISGSTLIALMLGQGGLSRDEAWSAAVVDENWNINLWGIDDEAATRLERRREEFGVAHTLWQSLA